MRLTFLGTGAATSLPLAFCRCETCREARAAGLTAFRARSALLVNDDMLIDFGPDVPLAMARFSRDLTKIRHWLQTHFHADHFDAGHIVTRVDDYQGRGVAEMALLASEESLRYMSEMLLSQEGDVSLMTESGRRRLKLSVTAARAGERREMGGYRVTPLSVEHEAGSLAYVVEQGGQAVLYATDVCRIPEESYAILSRFSLDAAILDHTYGPGIHSGGHMSADDVAATVARLKEMGALRANAPCLGTHLSHEIPPRAEMEAYAAAHGYALAYDGMTLSI